ncbi:hypothetical protein [Actinokineospora enzanensis]|uniref:hypothetical protein n=1 Tax=Actinokineospora enzanensis TaxID=155975 RepID=UPI000375D431|nr:hypothetical protein [Actinokineospora enzanensis]
MRSRRAKSLTTVLFLVVLLASVKRSAAPGDPPDPVATVLLSVLDAPLLLRVFADMIRALP